MISFLPAYVSRTYWQLSLIFVDFNKSCPSFFSFIVRCKLGVHMLLSLNKSLNFDYKKTNLDIQLVL